MQPNYKGDSYELTKERLQNGGDQNITPEMWEYAKLNYVNDTGIDNYMSYWFNKVKPKDIEKYVKWLNENSVAVATPLLLSNGNSESK